MRGQPHSPTADQRLSLAEPAPAVVTLLAGAGPRRAKGAASFLGARRALSLDRLDRRSSLHHRPLLIDHGVQGRPHLGAQATPNRSTAS
jgi:hypothetical protein